MNDTTWTTLDQSNLDHYAKKAANAYRVIADTLDTVHVAFCDWIMDNDRREFYPLASRLSKVAAAFWQHNAGAVELFNDVFGEFKNATQFGGVQGVLDEMRELVENHPAMFETEPEYSTEYLR